jgi:hypothetical protein
MKKEIFREAKITGVVNCRAEFKPENLTPELVSYAFPPEICTS